MSRVDEPADPAEPPLLEAGSRGLPEPVSSRGDSGSSISSSESSASRVARSTALASSRTFPGQG